MHVLLGIQYQAHFPELVHSLESGLGIYKLKLSPDGPATATIAGPHHSFNLMMEKVGNVSALLNEFARGLLQWNTDGPPMPECLPLTNEELATAARFNSVDTLTLDGITDWNNPLTLPSANLCATHLTPVYYGTPMQPPNAPKKPPRKLRIHTETREDFLDTDEEPTLPTWSSPRMCKAGNTSPEILNKFARSTQPCI